MYFSPITGYIVVPLREVWRPFGEESADALLGIGCCAKIGDGLPFVHHLGFQAFTPALVNQAFSRSKGLRGTGSQLTSERFSLELFLSIWRNGCDDAPLVGFLG